ncbi:MAG TPA: VOC family protein [Quisquiliibacterium sp.]|nr:VOC family protein [Quisquiliibacterium sp.]
MAGMSDYLNLRQICLAAPELGPAVDAVRAVFGLEVCYRDPNVAKYGLENALFVFGRAFLEIVAPTRADTAAGRFIERSGGLGGYMAIFDCSDPERRRERADGLGVRTAHVLDYPGYWGIQLHPRDCRATMLEFDRTEGAQDLDGPYHPAGEQWRDQQRLDRVLGIPLIETEGPDPAGLAAHWSRLMDRPLRDDGGRPRIDFDLGAVRFAGAPAGTPERLATAWVQVADARAVLDAATRHGLRVDGDGFRLAGMRFVPRL